MEQRHVRSDKRHVVVTGLGVVSPYGRGCEVYWQGLVQGQCMIGPLTLFPTDGFRSAWQEVASHDGASFGDGPAVTGDAFSAGGSAGSRGECRS